MMEMLPSRELVSHHLEETLELARALGRICQGGEVLALAGELGSGKTYFIKGLAAGLEVVDLEEVTSPSFIILREYKGRLPLYHLDFFRLRQLGEVLELGLEDFFYGPGVCAVEWADRFPQVLPEERLELLFTILGEEERSIKFFPRGERAQGMLKAII